MDLSTLEEGDPAPIFRQLYGRIRDLIITGTWKAGTLLPSSRGLAADMHLSRNTIIAAFEQLETEGYIAIKQGTRARVLPLPLGEVRRDSGRLPRIQDTLSKRGFALASLQHETGFSGGFALQPGLPDARSFPFVSWRRLVAKHLRMTPGETFGYHGYQGHRGLREVIAQYMRSSIGVTSKADQIIVTGGAQSAFNLLAHLLIDVGDPVMIEEPGYTGAQGAFLAAGARIEPLRVNGNRWSIEAITAVRPKVIYLTPSCQYPLGSTMRIDQRLRVLQLAAEVGAWIIEDGFDHEFNFVGSRAPTLKSQDLSHRTIYVGSFAKTMLPDLRLGFVIFPELFVRPIRRVNFLMGTSAPLATQAALADFIRDGDYARHTRRMRRMYALKRTLLVDQASALLGSLMEQIDEGNGLQTTWRFRRKFDDFMIAQRAVAVGVSATPLSIHYMHGSPEQGLIIGYAATEEKEIVNALQKLDHVIRQI